MAASFTFDVIDQWTLADSMRTSMFPHFDFDALVVRDGADGQLEDADHPPGRVLGGPGSENDMMVSCMAFDRRAWRGSRAERFFLLAQARVARRALGSGILCALGLSRRYLTRPCVGRMRMA
jgi:hypothetical protein